MSRDLVTRSRLDDSGFNQGLARMRRHASDFNRKIGSEFAQVFSGAALGAGVAAAFYKLGQAITGAFKRADEIDNISNMLGEMPADVVKVGTAAEIMGVGFESAVKAAVKLRVSLGQASEGGEKQNRALDAMGLKASELSGMALPDMILALAEGYRRAEASGMGYAAVQGLLSKGGVELIRLLSGSPEEIRRLFDEIKPASDAAVRGMGIVADQWELMVSNMKQRWMGFVWGVYAGFRQFKGMLDKESDVRGAVDFRFGNERKQFAGLPKAERIARERALSKKLFEEEGAKWDRRHAEDAGFIGKGKDFDPRAGKPGGVKGAVDDAGAGPSSEERAKKKALDGLIDAYWKAREAREQALRSEEQKLARNIAQLAQVRNLLARQGNSQEDVLRLRAQEQELLAKIEESERNIAESAKNRREEEVRAAGKRARDADEKAQEDARVAARMRELALEAAIEQLKSDGKDHALEEARLRLAAAEQEYRLARGTADEAERYVGLLAARNSLNEAAKGDKGNKNQRIRDYIEGGMPAHEARKRVREEMKQEHKNERAVASFDASVERKNRPSLVDAGTREYMDSHKNVSGAGAFDSGEWESGSYGQATRDAADRFRQNGEAAGESGDPQVKVLGDIQRLVQQLTQAVQSATGGGE